MNDVLFALLLSLLVQAIFFAFAARFKTDRVTDLSYGLTFIVIAVALPVRHADAPATLLTLAAMITAWGIRLASYLLYRIIQMKRDPRFDGIREDFWAFFRFWLFQGLAVWVIMLPATVWASAPGPWGWLKAIAMVAWAAGLAIETVADLQKFRQKRAGGTPRWMDTGLWHYSRHPNYFGELVCWWAVFLFVAGDLAGWQWLATAGPVTITFLLLRVTGIPTLERSAQAKWGQDPEYQRYRQRTRALLPWAR